MQFSANETVQAICRTLFHSLWQGVLLAIAGGLVVVFTKKLRAAVRYNILTALLMVFVAGAVSTFCYQLNSFASKPVITEAIQTITPIKITGNAQAYQTTAADGKPVTIKSVFVGWLTANAGLIVLAWLLVIAFRCVQMLVGLRGVYILRHKGLSDAGEYWVGRLTELAASIQLTKPVRLIQSAIAKVPMVTGHLKPIILLPLGVLTALPQDEIEAILLHELAHIRRKDYLVNMLQNICEIIFFFNPAVLWVSSLIKDERENCCDDIAIGEVKNKKQFIHALISFQEYNLAANNYAVGFPGRKDHLLNRVKRIITNNNKSLTNMEKAFLATGIVILSFITLAFAHKQAYNKPKDINKVQKETVQTKQDSVTETVDTTAAETIEAPVPPVVAGDNPVIDDTTKTKKETHISSLAINTNNNHQDLTMNTEYDGKEYKIVQKDGKLTALYVDGERVPDDKLDSYKPVLDQIKADMKAQQLKQFEQEKIQVREQQEQFKRQEDQFAEQQKQYEKQQEQFLKLSDANSNAQYKQQVQQGVQQYKEQQERYREQQRQYEKQFEDQQAQIVRQEEQYKKQVESGDEFIVGPIPPIPPIAPIGPIAPIAPIPPMEPMKPMEPFSPVPPVAPVAPIEPIEPIPPVPPTDNKTVNEIISVLEDANIITDEDNVSFSLNNSELIVNGVKQPDALQARLKKQYFKSATDYIKYKAKKRNNGKEISTDISIDSN